MNGAKDGSGPRPLLLDRQEGEILRCLSLLLVVALHCLSPAVQRIHHHPEGWFRDFGALFADQAFRFTVPLFFFLSGYGLGLSHPRGFGPSDRPAYFQRLRKLALPFFFWSLLCVPRHLEHLGALPWETDSGAAVYKTFHLFFIRGADYQLYFLILLFQLYLLLPLILPLARRASALFVFFALHLYLVQPRGAAFGIDFLQPAPLHNRSLLWFFFFAFLGLFAAGRGAAWRKKAASIPLPVWTGLSLLSTALLMGEFLAYSGKGIPLRYFDHFGRWTVLLHFLLVGGLLLALFERRSPSRDRSPAGAVPVTAALPLRSRLPPLGFGVFFVHTHFIRLVDGPLQGMDWPVAARILFVVLASYAATALLRRLQGFLPGLAALTGIAAPPPVSASPAAAMRPRALLLASEEGRRHGHGD